MNRVKSALLAVALAGPLAGATEGCDEKKPSSDTARTDAGATDKYATADPKLAKALQAAASATAASDNGPPPEGIFAPGAADRRHAKGTPTTLEVLGDGADPKVSLSGASAGDASTDAARATSYGPAALEVAQSMGQRTQAPTLDFGLVLSPAKPADGGTDVLLATAQSASLAKEQLAQAPPGMDKEIAALQGSQIRLKVTADGKQSDLSSLLAKNAKPDFDRLFQNAAEAFALCVVPLPGKPVGAGAQWIAETRTPMGGLDVVTYRAFRVKSVDGDRVHLTLDLKAYAADKNVQLAGLPPGATLEQFDAVGQGELELVRGESVARKADMQQRVVMVFAPAGGADKPDPGQPPQQQMMTAQIVSQSTFVRGEDLRQALKHP
jgi:hypothetical protein